MRFWSCAKWSRSAGSAGWAATPKRSRCGTCVAYTLDTQELCKTYRTVLDGLTSGHASEAIDYWCGWSDRVTVQYREALLQLGSE